MSRAAPHVIAGAGGRVLLCHFRTVVWFATCFHEPSCPDKGSIESFVRDDRCNRRSQRCSCTLAVAVSP
jgi:hypothetical protein